MELFSINDIENLSGIKAHTLRIWEVRYSILQPQRRESKHRFYDNEDLRHILQIAHLNRNGFKISKIAKMTSEQMRMLAQEKGIEDSYYENFIAQLVQSSLDFDEERFNKIYHTIVLHLGFEKVMMHVLFPLLNRIGIFWMTESVLPAQEHFLSHQITKKIMMGIQALNNPSGGSVTALFNLTGEHHEIPLLYLKYILKRYGKRSVYFGTNIQLGDIELYIEQQPIRRLHIHTITNLTYQTMNEVAEQMLNRFCSVEIVFSGPLTTQITFKHNRLIILPSLEKVIEYYAASDII